MGFRFRPDPIIENQLSEEARLLMEQEGQGWHAPQVLPNTPRDPAIDARKRAAMEVLLKNKNPQSPILPSQDPFAQRVPSEQEMAMTSAAVRHAQAPAQASVQSAQFKEYPDDFAPSQAEMDRHNPLAPTIERAGKELDVDRPSDLPGGEDNPSEPTPEDLMSKPGQSLARQALNQYMTGDEEEKDTRIPTFSDEYMKSLAGTTSTNRNVALMALLAKSSAQMGAVGGKVADTSGFDQFAGQAIQGNNDSMKYITNMEMEQLKARNKQSSKMDKTKLLLELAKMDQTRGIAEMNNDTRKEANAINGDIRKASLDQQGRIAEGLLGVRQNPPVPPLHPSQQRKTDAEAALLEDRINNPDKYKTPAAKKASLPIGVAESIKDRSKKIAKRDAMLNKIRSAYLTFSQEKDPKKKLDYGRTLIKMYNDPENPDAAGVEEARRAGANLNSTRLNETFDWMMGDAPAPLGRNLEGFGNTMLDMIKTMDNNNKLDKAELEKLYKANGLPNGGLTEGPNGELEVGQTPASATVTVLWKGRPKVIPADRLVEALEAGAKEMGK